MATRSIGWFAANGCELTTPSFGLFQAVYLASNGDPCRECNCKSTCPAWPRVHTLEAKVVDRTAPPVRRCTRCNSPLNLTKVRRRGGTCACGEPVKE